MAGARSKFSSNRELCMCCASPPPTLCVQAFGIVSPGCSSRRPLQRRFEMPKNISEQVVVIVGASSGIGLACAQDFARRGAKIVIAARNETDLTRAAESIARDGGQAVAAVADVTVFEDMNR